MNNTTLPILARLSSLQADIRVLPGGARVIAEAHDRNPVARLLRAANETMLARSLEFVSSAGPALTLDVAGRRLLRLTASHGLAGAESCLGSEVLEDEQKDDLIKLLQALAVPGKELRVISGPIGRGGAEVSVGLPVALLADLLLIDLNDVGAEEPEHEAGDVASPPPDRAAIRFSGRSVADFATGIGPVLVAWLSRGGQDDGRSEGPEEMVSHLRDFLDDEHAAVIGQLDLMSAQEGDPVCLMLGVTLIDGHSLVCARLHGTVLLGVIEGGGSQAALSAWRGLMA